jgi:hypothetical protein
MSAVLDLSSIQAPSEAASFQRDYMTMLNLRLDAILLYISGVEEDDMLKLERGDELWFESVAATSDIIDELVTLVDD